jgi:hypothetical protein
MLKEARYDYNNIKKHQDEKMKVMAKYLVRIIKL